MSADDRVRLERAVDSATLTLTNPNKANALSAETVRQLNDACAQLEQNPPAHVVVQAEGKNFCAGFDLSGMDASDDELRAAFVTVQELLTRVAALPTVTIALVAGPAIGAGADLVAACDIRAGTPAARFQFPGPRFSLMLGSDRQRQILTPTGLVELTLRTRRVDAAEAHRHGLLTHLIADEDVDTWHAELVGDLARRCEGARQYQLALIRGSAMPTPSDLVRRSLAAPDIARRMGLNLTAKATQ